jgi:hypothetical protein
MSRFRESVIELCRTPEESERKRILREFIKVHGEHYTLVDLLNYLEKKYRTRLSPTTLPLSSQEQEIAKLDPNGPNYHIFVKALRKFDGLTAEKLKAFVERNGLHGQLVYLLTYKGDQH